MIYRSSHETESYTLLSLNWDLQERKPELTTEVMAFRDYLLSSTISDTLEVWELKGTDFRD